MAFATLLAVSRAAAVAGRASWARSGRSTGSCRPSGTTSASRVAADLFDTGSGLVNMVAAMPSLHAAYPATLLLFFWNDGKWWRIVLGAYTLAMGFALVYGGEHFVVDILVGWLYAGVAYTLVCVAWPAWRGAARAGTSAGVRPPSPSPPRLPRVGRSQSLIRCRSSRRSGLRMVAAATP